MAMFQDIVELNKKMLDAEKRQDKSFYQQLLSEDFHFRRANGQFADKNKYVDGLTATNYSTLEAWDYQPFLLAKDIAFVECRVSAEGTRPDGTTFQGTFINVRFFRRSDSGWQLYAWHNVASDNRGDAESTFTGHVIRQTLSEQPENHVYQVFFHPSARTHWHIHTGIQDLFVVSGSAFVVQKTQEGDRRVIVSSGEKIRIAPGILHWHGATPETFMIHVTNNLRNKLLYSYWFHPVSDEQYYPG